MKLKVGKGRPVAFDFVLDELFPVNPRVKPMFGCHAVYVKDQIVLILRKKEGVDSDNGVWVATTQEHHDSLRKDLPSIKPISVFGGVQSGWRNLPSADEHFEEEVMKVCNLIIKGDHRIGKTPKPRKKIVR
jgi:hypothetical protein